MFTLYHVFLFFEHMYVSIKRDFPQLGVPIEIIKNAIVNYISNTYTAETVGVNAAIVVFRTTDMLIISKSASKAATGWLEPEKKYSTFLIQFGILFFLEAQEISFLSHFKSNMMDIPCELFFFHKKPSSSPPSFWRLFLKCFYPNLHSCHPHPYPLKDLTTRLKVVVAEMMFINR